MDNQFNRAHLALLSFFKVSFSHQESALERKYELYINVTFLNYERVVISTIVCNNNQVIIQFLPQAKMYKCGNVEIVEEW